MDQLFSGSISKQRQINLGGRSGPVSASQLAAQARAERQARDLLRRQEQCATTIQRVWKGSQVRADKRRLKRRQFHDLHQSGTFSLTNVDETSISASIRATRALVEAVQTKAGASTSKGRRPRRPRTALEQEEDRSLAAWAESMITPVAGANGSPLMTALSTVSPKASQWDTQAFAALSEVYVRLVESAGLLDSHVESTFLRLYSALWDPHQPLSTLGLMSLKEGHYAVIWSVISAMPTERRASTGASELVCGLVMQPFELLRPAQQATAASVPDITLSGARKACSDIFARDILSLPLLPNRIAIPSLAKLAASFPIVDVVQSLADQSIGTSDSSAASINQLANFVALAHQRVPQFADGATLNAYLDSLSLLQQRAGKAQLVQTHDAETQKRLALISSTKHLSAIFSISAKSPTTTRPKVHLFLCSLIFSWGDEIKTATLNAILYGSGQGLRSQAAGGFVREMWRGYVRSSAVVRKIGATSASVADSLAASGSSNVNFDASLFNQPLEGWSSLVLLCELYSRLLLTLGDDEFFTSAGPGRSTARPQSGGNAGEAASAKNPLTLDEILSFSAIVRNLAFTLYWRLDHSSSLPSGSNMASTSSLVPDAGCTFLDLRDTATRLLQQIHARDARHRFTPEDHWLMTSELEMQSFVDSVLLEEDKIAEGHAEADGGNGDAMDVDNAPDERYAPDEVLPSISGRAPKRHISARKMAFISPRLGILNNLPFVIPFETRIKIFRAFVYRDAKRLQLDSPVRVFNPKQVRIRREHVAEDGIEQLNIPGNALKERLEITFVDQFGMREAGIDGGGVFKEFLTSLIREAFDTDRGLWKATDQQDLYPNPLSFTRQADQLQWYTFLGRMLGKALYEGILVNVRFAPFFLSKWLGRTGLSHLDDLASLDSLDSELYRGLIYLKNYEGDVEQDLSLNFTVTDDELGVQTVKELIPNGGNIPVTEKNRLSYIFLMANYRLEGQIRAQCSAFFVGLSEMIDPRWLRIFDQVELQHLIKGSDEPIDVEDLKKNTVFSGYHEKDTTIEYLWEALESFDQATRSAFVKFVTSCPSPPLLGFGQLNPKFCIALAGQDEQRLPTSSTCVNLLRLPRYESLERTREKILTAVQSGAGFDLQ